MKSAAVLYACLLLFAATGCPRNKYRIEMRWDENGRVQRETTLWVQDGETVSSPKDEHLQAARGIYGEAEAREDKKARFSGVFSAELPADLRHENCENRGYVGTTSNVFGTITTYLENMPGQRDLRQLVRTAESLVERVARIFIEWVRTEPGFESDPTARERLSSYLEGELQADAMNLLLLAWQAVTRFDLAQEADAKSEEWKEKIMKGEGYRIVAYLIEREYLRPGEVPRLLDEPSQDLISTMLLRKAARVMGYESENQCPGVLRGALRDPEKLQKIFEEGLQAMGWSQERLEAEVNSIVPIMWGNGTDIELSWKSPNPPVETNGTWDETRGQVSWTAEGRSGCQTPRILYAVWATPNATAQQGRFGSVVLEGQRLRDYIVWYDNLTSEERSEWDGLLETVRPESAWKETLRKFRFTNESDGAATQPTEMPRGSRLILNEEPAN